MGTARRWIGTAAIVGLALMAACSDDGDSSGKDGGPEGPGGGGATVGYDDALEAPCELVSVPVASAALGGTAERTSSAPSCSYRSDDANLSVHLSRLGEGVSLAEIVPGGEPVAELGDEASWTPGQGIDSGLLHTRRGGAVILVDLVRPGSDQAALQAAATDVAEAALARLGPVAPLPAQTTTTAATPTGCDIVDVADLIEAVGLPLELAPAESTDSCSFTAGDVTLRVGPVTRPVTPEAFATLRREAEAATAQGFTVTDVEGAGDQAVLLEAPTDLGPAGNLLALGGDTVVAVSVTGGDVEGVAVAAAQAVLAAGG